MADEWSARKTRHSRRRRNNFRALLAIEVAEDERLDPDIDPPNVADGKAADEFYNREPERY